MNASLMLAEGQREQSRCRSEKACILAALWRRPTFVRLTFCRRSMCMQNGGTVSSVLPESAGRWCDGDGVVVQHRRRFCAIASGTGSRHILHGTLSHTAMQSFTGCMQIEPLHCFVTWWSSVDRRRQSGRKQRMAARNLPRVTLTMAPDQRRQALSIRADCISERQ